MDENTMLNIVIPKDIADIKLPDPDLLGHYKDIENRLIWIDGDIDECLLQDVGGQILEYNRQDKGIPVEERKKIVILINSGGGVLDSTYATIAIIERSKTPVITVNMSMAHSAAGLILLAGHKRYCMPRSQMLIHSGSASGISGNYEDIQESTKAYKKIVEDMRTYIIEKSKIERSLLMKHSKSDWYLTDEEQINLGCADCELTDIDNIL